MKKLSKQVENDVGKGKIARYEQFLLIPQCFQKACFLGASKGVVVWEWVMLCTYPAEFSPRFYGIAPRYALKKFDKCQYALKSPIRFNLISDTAWC